MERRRQTNQRVIFTSWHSFNCRTEILPIHTETNLGLPPLLAIKFQQTPDHLTSIAHLPVQYFIFDVLCGVDPSQFAVGAVPAVGAGRSPDSAGLVLEGSRDRCHSDIDALLVEDCFHVVLPVVTSTVEADIADYAVKVQTRRYHLPGNCNIFGDQVTARQLNSWLIDSIRLTRMKRDF